jgi:hypothetical protein
VTISRKSASSSMPKAWRSSNLVGRNPSKRCLQSLWEEIHWESQVLVSFVFVFDLIDYSNGSKLAGVFSRDILWEYNLSTPRLWNWEYCKVCHGFTLRCRERPA